MREQIEEYLPQKGVFHRSMVELVRARYNFQIFPQFLPGTMPPMFQFAGGMFPDPADSFAVNQLVMKEDGDVVMATTTDQAERVLDDLAKLLDDNLGFRLSTSYKPRAYLSNIVVEFDAGLEDLISSLSKIASVINSFRADAVAFNLKRLGFGHGEVVQTNDLQTAVEMADFLIERRAGNLYASNRYFCSAPMTTANHLATLERIEAMLRGDID